MRRTRIFMAAILLAAPAPLLAQDPGAGDATEQRDGDDGNSRTGLLGLIGLIGLFGLMRREPAIHVDARQRGTGPGGVDRREGGDRRDGGTTA
jgi:MYXO-CTERM domain-containing protein